MSSGEAYDNKGLDQTILKLKLKVILEKVQILYLIVNLSLLWINLAQWIHM